MKKDKIKKDKISKKIDKNIDQKDHKRLLAELANLRMQHENELQQTRLYAVQPLVGQLIEVLNNFELTLNFKAKADEAKRFMQGVRMTQTLLLNILAGYGVSKIECSLGTPFSSKEHEAIDFTSDGSLKDGAVAKILQAGYRLHERIIQATKVVVNKKKAAKSKQKKD